MGLQESLKARRAARRSLDKTVEVATSTAKDTTKTPEAERRQILLDTLEELRLALEKWEATQMEVEIHIADADLEASVDEADAVRKEQRQAKRAVILALHAVSPNGHVTPGSVSVASSEATRLPKLDLPHFEGNVKDWPSFWELFANAVDKTEIPAISKFAYLRTVIKGDAARCVEGLSLTAAHYTKAVELLKARFGRKELIVVSHVQSLLSLQVKANTTDALRTSLDRILADVRSLETLEIKGEQYGVFLTPIILAKLPEQMRMSWARQSKEKESDCDFLLDFIKDELESRERSHAFSAAAETPKTTEERRAPRRSAVSAQP